MATRANIKIIEGDKVTWLYHHWDGYPEYLGAFLLWRLYNRLENTNYYIDTGYIVNGLLKDKADDGFEYTTDMHGDIKYLYEVNIDNRTLRCFEMEFVENPNEKGTYEIKLGDEVNLKTSVSEYKPVKTTVDNKEVWYLCDYRGNNYLDDKHCTAYFDSKEQAQTRAFEHVFEVFDAKYKDKGE